MKKTRTDSWAACLSEEQGWTLYYRAMRCPWQEAAAWAAREFGLAKAPSRTGFYAWLAQMRAAEHEHRMHEAATAAAEAAALGRRCTRDEALVEALKALATEAALNTDAKTASSLIQSALAIKDRLQRADDLAIRAKAQATREADLALAREKFEAAERRLSAVQDAVRSAKSRGGLTEETLRKIEEAAGLL